METASAAVVAYDEAAERRHLALREEFLLDPNVVFLNHGSFGACPRPVFERYQAWQRELERQPVEFLGRRREALLAEARGALTDYLHVGPDDAVYVPNVTTALNIVARSLPLEPGDEVLTTNHEYGALERTWTFVSEHRQTRVVVQHLPVPLADPDEVVEAVWAGVTPRTRVLFLSHITSPTAVTLPIEPLIARARAAGIWTVVDGAHAPGQVDLDLTDLGVDFYGGNSHKWLSAPKGAGFLYVRPDLQHLIEPVVVSWGWRPNDPGASVFVDKMATLPLPPCDAAELKRRLYDEHQIEIPATRWGDVPCLRVSVQGYNTRADIERLVAAVAKLLPGSARAAADAHA
ncbi:MAG: aminotransferase class V-fold PLP-dependent enzyme [Chloroflexi bacterium]|nr:aminotransferase class V-fold PLP-dependent enzyme [Chloroflexota bacterium]